MYSIETKALRKAEERALERTEIRMQRWIVGINLRQKKRTKIHANLRVLKKIKDKCREAILRWLGYVLRKDERKVREANKQEVTGKTRGRKS